MKSLRVYSNLKLVKHLISENYLNLKLSLIIFEHKALKMLNIVLLQKSRMKKIIYIKNWAF